MRMSTARTRDYEFEGEDEDEEKFILSGRRPLQGSHDHLEVIIGFDGGLGEALQASPPPTRNL